MRDDSEQSGLEPDPDYPKHMVRIFWVKFFELVECENDRRLTSGEEPFQQKDVAKLIGVPPQTLSYWKTSDVMPGNLSSLKSLEWVAVERLQGVPEDWRALCEGAHRAHQEAIARKRSGSATDLDSGSHEPGGPRSEVLTEQRSSDGEKVHEGGSVPVSADKIDRLPSALPSPAMASDTASGVNVSSGGRRKRVLAGAIAATVVVGGVYFYFAHGTGAAQNNEGAGSANPATSSRSSLCAYVMNEPAWVYNAPNASSGKLKEKPVNSGITILDLPHPPGWTAVSTPFDPPGYAWMQTAVLSAPYDGPHPCRDHT